jgi:hypothetical protein
MKSLVFVLLLLLSSCENELKEPLNYKENLSEEVVKLKITSQLLSEIAIDENIVMEVKEGIETNLSYGLDEELRFKEVLQPQSSKISIRSSNHQSKLANAIRDVFNNSTIQLRTSINGEDFSGELEEFVCENNIQIYWPYSENWNGKELPVIAYNPMSDDVTEIMAYRYHNESKGISRLDSLVIDEEYAMEHPVWIINKNEFDYDDIPDFKDGEIEKNGVIYVSKSLANPNDNKIKTETRAASSVFLLGTITAREQHDSWVNGGSEFDFVWAYIVPNSYTQCDQKRIRKCISRSDIKKGRTHSINLPLNVNWTEPQLTNGLMVTETDNCVRTGNMEWYCYLELYKDNKQSRVFNCFYYGKCDELIHTGVYWRSNVTSRYYNQKHANKGVSWTMYMQ